MMSSSLIIITDDVTVYYACAGFIVTTHPLTMVAIDLLPL